MAKRSKEEILANMLEISLDPVKKTAIMYGATLSFTQLQLYTRLLQRTEMIGKVEENGVSYWVTTSKGRDFLRAYQTVRQFIK